jgi:hypothetical protein
LLAMTGTGFHPDAGGQRSCHREGNVQQRQRPFDFGVETFRRLRRLGEIIVASQKATYRMEAERAVDLELLLASASDIAPILQQNFEPTTRREAPRSEDDGVAVLDVLKCPPNTRTSQST